MTVRVLTGDMFESKCQTLVNTVNCVGVMGKGVALGFRERFSNMYEDYVARCRRGEVNLGRPYLFKSLVWPWILNFPTKQHWRSVSRIADIVAGFDYLEEHLADWGISSLAVPPLGCGQGGLEWSVVGPTLYGHLKRLEIPVELYAPIGSSSMELSDEFLSGRFVPMKPSRQAIAPGLVALVEILRRIEEEPHHWPVGRTIFQKIAYFVTAEGFDTGLSFERASFGPFSSKLKATIGSLLNNGVIQEEHRGRMFRVTVGPTFGDLKRNLLEDSGDVYERIDKIADLFLRINTTNQAELAASVHFAAEELVTQLGRKPNEVDVLEAVLEWKRRRRPPLETKAVANTIRQLGSMGWLNVDGAPDLPIEEEPEFVGA